MFILMFLVPMENQGDSASSCPVMATIREYRVLYDKSVPGYRDPTAKENAWKEVASS